MKLIVYTLFSQYLTCFLETFGKSSPLGHVIWRKPTLTVWSYFWSLPSGKSKCSGPWSIFGFTSLRHFNHHFCWLPMSGGFMSPAFGPARESLCPGLAADRPCDLRCPTPVAPVPRPMARLVGGRGGGLGRAQGVVPVGVCINLRGWFLLCTPASAPACEMV